VVSFSLLCLVCVVAISLSAHTGTFAFAEPQSQHVLPLPGSCPVCVLIILSLLAHVLTFAEPLSSVPNPSHPYTCGVTCRTCLLCPYPARPHIIVFVAPSPPSFSPSPPQSPFFSPSPPLSQSPLPSPLLFSALNTLAIAAIIAICACVSLQCLISALSTNLVVSRRPKTLSSSSSRVKQCYARTSCIA
jgi:hypothetical protein